MTLLLKIYGNHLQFLIIGVKEHLWLEMSVENVLHILIVNRVLHTLIRNQVMKIVLIN